MSETLILFRTVPYTHHFPGDPEPRTWELGRSRISTEAAYAKYLSGLALAGIEMHREAMAPATHRLAIEGWVEKFPKGKYNWGSRDWWDTLDDEKNARELLWIFFDEAEERAIAAERLKRKDKLTSARFTEMVEERGKEIVAVVNGRQVSAMGRLLAELTTDPNRTPPPVEATPEAGAAEPATP